MSRGVDNSTIRPAIIITGYLGSGKTTYLNQLLNKRNDIKYAIIENEYGEESIDSDLILTSEDDIIELNNGCLCCTLNDNLYDILNRLYNRREEFDELIIEATGMADPRGIAAPFITNASVKKAFPLKAIICLVDAEYIEDQLSETVEAIHQITYSDILVINKIDLVSKDYVTTLIKKLKTINPLAKIVTGEMGQFSSIDLSQVDFTHLDQQLALSTVENEKNEGFPISNPERHHHHEHTDVVTYTLSFHEPFDLYKLRLILMGFLMVRSKNIFRMKGLLRVKESNQNYLLQSVGMRLSIDAVAGGSMDQKSKIIVIGKNINKEEFINIFDQCK